MPNRLPVASDMAKCTLLSVVLFRNEENTAVLLVMHVDTCSCVSRSVARAI